MIIFECNFIGIKSCAYILQKIFNQARLLYDMVDQGVSKCKKWTLLVLNLGALFSQIITMVIGIYVVNDYQESDYESKEEYESDKVSLNVTNFIQE